MPKLPANGIEISYDSFGDENADPLLLIMGLGAQMLLWHEDFCEALAERGHWVIRYDNRDVGLSTCFDEAGVPDMAALAEALTAGKTAEPPYTVDDMADDGVGLLTGLGIQRAHICGASMGGMIAQTLAFNHPKRVRSLTSIMSTSGDPDLPPPKPHVIAKLLETPPGDRESSIAHSVEVARTIGSPDFPTPEGELRERATLMFDRSFHPEGTARQLAAIVAQGSRREKLRALDVPALVIHGKADDLVPFEGGVDTLDCIEGAEALWIEGMGHDLPRPLWPEIIAAIRCLTERA
ncbi:MAG: alpha/beta fold hydrolase [Myxococcota bacterium]